jgi:hypothetical protein
MDVEAVGRPEQPCVTRDVSRARLDLAVARPRKAREVGFLSSPWHRTEHAKEGFMSSWKGSRTSSTIRLAGLALAMVACATLATAQDREGKWEFSIGPTYQGSASLKFDGGSTVKTKGDWGLTTAVAYNFTESLAGSLGIQWGGISYDANVIQDGGGSSKISGTYDSWTTSANLIYNFKEGPVVPFVSAGLGYSWIDTNVPNGLPTTGCWWDPWYGYVCSTSYPTKTTDALAYQASLGLRYEYSPSAYVRFAYTSQWLDLSKATSTPRFDVFTLDFGWLF